MRSDANIDGEIQTLARLINCSGPIDATEAQRTAYAVYRALRWARGRREISPVDLCLASSQRAETPIQSEMDEARGRA